MSFKVLTRKYVQRKGLETRVHYDKNGSVRRVHVSPYFKPIDSGGMIWQFLDDSLTASFIMGFRSPIACASTLLSLGESLRIAAKGMPFAMRLHRHRLELDTNAPRISE